MKKTAQFLLKSIVNYPEEVKVTTSQENDFLTLNLKVSPEDIGQVIGKNGRTIKALTSLLKIKAIKEGKMIRVEVQESKTQNSSSTEEADSVAETSGSSLTTDVS